MISVNMNNNFSYKNQKIDDIEYFIKGYLFFENEFYTKDSMVSLIHQHIDSKDTFTKFLKNIDGIYSIVVNTRNEVLCAVDSTRSLPLFYFYNNENLHISDNANQAVKDLNLTNFNRDNIEEFKCNSIITGNETLVNSLMQLEAGQLFIFDKYTKVQSLKFYYYYIGTKVLTSTKEDLFKKADIVGKNAFNRLLNSIKNKTIVVPLSGGYDSRYVVSMLKSLNYKNVVCFSYGRADSFEVAISKDVANKLNFKWYFIEYTDELVKETVESEQFKDFCKYCANYSSVPHFQDYIAVKYLHDNGMIPNDSMFVPGHSGDLLGGSHLRNLQSSYLLNEFSEIFDTNQVISDFWYRENKSNLNKLNKEYIYNKINDFFIDLNVSEVNLYPYLTDTWDIANRQSKFIINSCRVYDFFNYEFRLPLWDRELATFWLSLPLQYKLNEVLYDEYLLKEIFNKYGIDIKKVSTNSEYKKLIKKILGKNIFNLLKKIKNVKNDYKKDFNSFDTFIEYMSKDIKYKYEFQKFHIDHMSAVWYLENLLGVKYDNNY